MKLLLFLLLTSTELLYILVILEPETTKFDAFLLILMFLISLFIRLILYSIGYAPKWNLGTNLCPLSVEAKHILVREKHYEPPRTRRSMEVDDE